MENILEPFIKISEKEVITLTALEKKIGASKGVLSRAVANNTDIQGKWFKKLVENYPQYNIDWLLTGRGEMLRSAEPIGGQTHPDREKYIEVLEAALADKEKIVKLLEDRIKQLEGKLLY